MRLSALALACTLAAPVAAPVAVQAQGLTFNGLVAVDHVSSGGAGRTIGHVDLTFGTGPGGDGGFGFEAGVWGFATTPGGVNGLVPFAALTYGLGGGRLHVGAPRPGAHGFNTNPVITGAQASVVETGVVTGHVPFSTLSSALGERPMVGLRYDRQSGALRYAASLGRIVASPGLDVISVGIAHEGPRTRLFGTLEHLRGAGGGTTIAMVGGNTRLNDRIEVGGSLLHSTGTGTTFVSAFATARVNDRLSLTASALANTSGTTQIFAVNAAYDVWNGVTVNAGVGHSSGAGSLWTLGLSRRF